MKHLWVLLLCLGLGGSGLAQKTFADRAPGNWEGSGTLFGMEARFSMIWEKTLNDKFLKLTFQNRFMDKNNNVRVMDAQGFYNTETGKRPLVRQQRTNATLSTGDGQKDTESIMG